MVQRTSELQLQNGAKETANLKPDPTMAASYDLFMPPDSGDVGDVWTRTADGKSEFLPLDLTNKTLTNPTITNYTESFSALGNSGTDKTINLDSGTILSMTLTDNCLITFPANTAGKSFLLILKQDGSGGKTVTWDSDVRWPSSVAPTLTSTANKVDIFSFVCDGTYWYGATGGQNYL